MVNTSARSAMVYSPVAAIRASSRCCRADSFGCLPCSLPLARATAMPSRVRIRSRSTSNSAKVARMLKNILPIGGQPDPAAGQVVTDGAGVGPRRGEPVELGHDQGVAFADGGQGLVQAGTATVGAGEAVVEGDAGVGGAGVAAAL